MTAELETLQRILARSLAEAGIPGAAPESLPERIAELRFLGTSFVPRGEYPRRGVEKERAVERERIRERAPLSSVESLLKMARTGNA